MLRIHYLGTAASVPVPGRCNTSLVVDDGRELTLVDASDAPFRRVAEAGLDPERLAQLIITHEHADHVFGLPSLLQSLWVAGRREPLAVYALAETWPLLDRLIDVFRFRSWANSFPLERRVIRTGSRPFLETPTLAAWAAESRHSVPTAALRFESGGQVVSYSADTAPIQSVVDLAQGSNLLIHEATFLAGHDEEATRVGHSTPAQAARAASEAGVRCLHLVHFTPTAPEELELLRQQASRFYGGPISVPSDLNHVELA